MIEALGVPLADLLLEIVDLFLPVHDLLGVELMLLPQGLQLRQFFFEGDFVHVAAVLNGPVIRLDGLLAAALGLLRRAAGRLGLVIHPTAAAASAAAARPAAARSADARLPHQGKQRVDQRDHRLNGRQRLAHVHAHGRLNHQRLFGPKRLRKHALQGRNDARALAPDARAQRVHPLVRRRRGVVHVLQAPGAFIDVHAQLFGRAAHVVEFLLDVPAAPSRVVVGAFGVPVGVDVLLDAGEAARLRFEAPQLRRHVRGRVRVLPRARRRPGLRLRKRRERLRRAQQRLRKPLRALRRALQRFHQGRQPLRRLRQRRLRRLAQRREVARQHPLRAQQRAPRLAQGQRLLPFGHGRRRRQPGAHRLGNLRKGLPRRLAKARTQRLLRRGRIARRGRGLLRKAAQVRKRRLQLAVRPVHRHADPYHQFIQRQTRSPSPPKKTSGVTASSASSAGGRRRAFHASATAPISSR